VYMLPVLLSCSLVLCFHGAVLSASYGAVLERGTVHILALDAHMEL
jgi:hypothetical protein